MRHERSRKLGNAYALVQACGPSGGPPPTRIDRREWAARRGSGARSRAHSCHPHLQASWTTRGWQGRSPTRAGSGTPFLGQRCAAGARRRRRPRRHGHAGSRRARHPGRDVQREQLGDEQLAVRLRAALRARPGHDRLPVPLRLQHGGLRRRRRPRRLRRRQRRHDPRAHRQRQRRRDPEPRRGARPGVGQRRPALQRVQVGLRRLRPHPAPVLQHGRRPPAANRMYAMVYTNADSNPGLELVLGEQPGRQGVRGRPQRPQHDRPQRRRCDRRPRPARGRRLVEQRRLLVGVGTHGRRGQHLRRLRRVRDQRRRHAPALVRDPDLGRHPAGVQPALLRLHGEGRLHAEADQRAAPGDPDRGRRLRARRAAASAS